ncbi:MAG: hypothetical protein LBI53_04765 [Candidatus Peribacteria bacterium]|jgi:hypothetical protein|nr:hypothetical protein [Candidatus Peribacteria bacterium]
MKRFKQVDIIHTDMEVKNKGIELIKIKGEYGVVQGYQNIKLYEIIDFDKPARSMQIGMMPAKLTHTLINIGVSLPPSIKGAVRRTGNFRSKGNFKDN